MDEKIKDDQDPKKKEEELQDEERIEEIEEKEAVLDENIEKKADEVHKEFKGIVANIKEFLFQLLNIKVETDKVATAQTIRENISIKGHTAWILVFSILVASIGLNMSSTPVVIGAMLISPLMGPILGVGFSVGINDVETLRSSIVNFGVMVGLSILTSFLFFSIPIFQEATPELLYRTKPDVRDVLIAIFSGFALFIAISRPKPQFNTVAGVAIATALMPPLCTAGFGLAIGNFQYFWGALFLFTINSIYIGLASFAITKYLHFPMVRYIKQVKQKRISQIAMLVGTVIFIFGMYLFYQLYIENKYMTNAHNFIQNLKKEGVNVIGNEKDIIDYENKEIKLYVFGSHYTQSDIDRWKNEMSDFGLNTSKLTVLQSQDDSRVRDDIDEIKELYINTHKLLSTREETIQEKDLRIQKLERDLMKYYKQEIPIKELTTEIGINYDGLKKIVFSKEFVSDFKKLDTVRTLYVVWDKNMKPKERRNREKKLKKWLETRYKFKNFEVKELK